jgi:hypothetical protein
MFKAVALGWTGEDVRQIGQLAIITAPVLKEEECKAYQERRKIERKERARINRILRKHGYRWIKDYDDLDQLVWTVHAPNGSAVALEQALTEIEKE